MSDLNDTTETPSTDDRPLDARDAERLLTQTRESAERQLEFYTPLLLIGGGAVFLVAFGAIWMSVRHQHPYSGPSLGSIGILYLLVLIVDVFTLVRYRRSSKGVGGRFTQQRRVLSAVGGTGLVAAYVIMGALEHAGVSHTVVYGIYPATVPLVVGGMVGAVGASSREDWTLFTGSLVIVAVAAGAAFGGPVGAWAVSGIGCAAVLIGCAVVKLVQRRS